MCGIAGIIALQPAQVSTTRLKQMTDALAHRGPDGEGAWLRKKGLVGFGHRRLAIIDLSKAAAQPMHYNDRYTIIHNGEIYNYIELRADLQKKGYKFQTQSDTEVILAAYDHFGVDCLDHFEGMFAFTIWDEQEQQLFAARDRFGEKPFYYYSDKEQFLFASEIKALWAAGIRKKMDQSMLLNYLAAGLSSSIDPNECFYQDIFSLLPAHYLLLSLSESNASGQIKCSVKRYWKINHYLQPFSISMEEAQNGFQELFFSSVEKRLRSDVPFGSSLSGGIDSSSVVAAICQVSPGSKTLKTFSAIFPGYARDESEHINEVVKHLSLENCSIIPRVDDFIIDFERMLHFHDEPVGSISTYVQYMVFELAKEHGVKVLLDGQGADELLGGYTKYVHWYLQEQYLLKGKRSLDQEIADFRNNNIPFEWNWRNYLAARLPSLTARLLAARTASTIKNDPFLTEDFKQEHYDRNTIDKPVIKGLNDILYYDSFYALLPELLRYADRNSMAHGREVRLPFLDHELARFLFRLSAEYKMNKGYGKRLLRLSMEQFLPPSIAWRKDKIGFEAPQELWMQDSRMHEYIQTAKQKLVNNRILKSAVMDKKIQPLETHAAENYDWRYLVAGTIL